MDYRSQFDHLSVSEHRLARPSQGFILSRHLKAGPYKVDGGRVERMQAALESYHNLDCVITPPPLALAHVLEVKATKVVAKE